MKIKFMILKLIITNTCCVLPENEVSIAVAFDIIIKKKNCKICKTIKLWANIFDIDFMINV